MQTFLQDDDTHWYLIDTDDAGDFIRLLYSDEDKFNERFSDNRCEHPSNYYFDLVWRF